MNFSVTEAPLCLLESTGSVLMFYTVETICHYFMYSSGVHAKAEG